MYLESGLYTCSALAEKFNVSIESSNFKRDICKKLEDSGYEYNYIHKTKGIEIKGQVGEKELTEIELKKYLISIGFGRNVNVKEVVLFIFLLHDDYYKNAPYKKIAQAMIEYYNITDYSDIDKLARRLGRHKKILEDNNLIHATRNADNPWVTFGAKKNKVQKSLSELTPTERDIYNNYMEERNKILDIFYNENIEERKKIVNIIYNDYDMNYDDRDELFDYICYEDILKYLYKEYKISVYPGFTKELNGINSDLIKKFIDFFLLE